MNSPMEFLYIIHNEMDHNKLAIPKMQRYTKATAELGQIPISLTGMLIHDHGDDTYGYYAMAF
jgi:hypothetical protein